MPAYIPDNIYFFFSERLYLANRHGSTSFTAPPCDWRNLQQVQALDMPSDDARDLGGETSQILGRGDDSAAITINVKSLCGDDFQMAIPRDIVVSDLKTRIRERVHVEEVSRKTRCSKPRGMCQHLLLVLMHILSIPNTYFNVSCSSSMHAELGS